MLTSFTQVTKPQVVTSRLQSALFLGMGLLKVRKPFAHLLLLLAVLLSVVPLVRGVSVQAAEGPATEMRPGTAHLQADAVLNQFPADGIYLYGQAQTPNQLGATYLVFEASRGDLRGAIYMPHSSFDCFSAEVQGTRLAMNITNSYEQEVYTHSLALDASAPVAGNGAQAFGLDGFHQIERIGENEQQILSRCLEALPQQEI